MASVLSAITNTIPITQFNRGLAGKIFDEVKRCGAKVVMKNNIAECVLLSPEEYVHLMQMFVKHSPDGDENMWQCVYDAEISWVNDDDQWAYINLPEKDGE